MEKFLKANGFKSNIHSDAWDKENTRVYFDDIDIMVVRFNITNNQLIEWKNRIDGNMPTEGKEKLIITMAGL